MELLKIKTEQFEGPLDLLLFLIQKNELDISAISIHKITDQYVQYVETIYCVGFASQLVACTSRASSDKSSGKELNFDNASEFLVLAATLIYLKSKKLLPDLELEEGILQDELLVSSEEELVARLREYKKLKEASKELLKRPLLGEHVFTRPNIIPPEKQKIWKELDVTALTLVFQKLLKRTRQRTKIVLKEPISLPERIIELSKILKVGELTEFSSILSSDPDRQEIIVTFLALLELSRLCRVKIFQNDVFGSIYLTLTENIQELNAALITGFEYRKEMALHGNA